MTSAEAVVALCEEEEEEHENDLGGADDHHLGFVGDDGLPLEYDWEAWELQAWRRFEERQAAQVEQQAAEDVRLQKLRGLALEQASRAAVSVEGAAEIDPSGLGAFCGAFAKDDLIEALCQSLDELPKDALSRLSGRVEHFGRCAVCMEETDVLLLECQHAFCSDCLSGQLAAKWPGLRVVFSYLHCALCRVPLAHQKLQRSLAEHEALRQQVLSVAERKFREDGLHSQLQDQAKRAVTKEEVRARAAEEMAVYMCFDCGKPYCGGRVDCADQQEVRAEQLLCRPCEWQAMADDNDRRCMVHGHKYAVFKCDSCCAVAVWNCVSHHYCERCHNEAYEEKNYPCPGPGLCPLGIPHPKNVGAHHGRADGKFRSFVIGCMACLGGIEPDSEDGDHLNFSGANQFGYPARDWNGFASGEELLAALGEQEVRGRLRARRQPVPHADTAAACAERLLLLERGIDSSEALLQSSDEKALAARLRAVGLADEGAPTELAARLLLLRDCEVEHLPTLD